MFDKSRRRRVAVAGDNELIDKVIESRTEVVQAVTDDDPELNVRCVEDFDLYALLAALTVEFRDVPVRVSLLPEVDLRLQALEVLERSI